MSTYSDAVLAHTPTGYWRLGEPSGSTFADLSGNGHTLTIAGGVTLGVEGAVRDGNTAATFNGTTGLASTSSGVNVWSGTAAISFEGWVNNPAWAGAGAHEMVLSLGSTGLYLSVQNGQPFMSINLGTQRTNGATATISANAWHHLVGTWASGDYLRLYVDGALVALSNTTVQTGTLATNANIGVGATAGGSSFTSGTLDEVALYPTALTAAQVAGHFGAGMPGTTLLPTAWPAFVMMGT